MPSDGSRWTRGAHEDGQVSVVALVTQQKRKGEKKQQRCVEEEERTS